MPRPLQQVHRHPRRVGELHEGDPVGRDRADRVDRQPARQDVEAVEDDPEPPVVGTPHHLPGVAVVADVPAPGQRLEADLDAEAVGDLRELAQVGRRPVDAAERQRRDVGADEDRRRARARSSARTCASPARSRGCAAARACPRSRGTAGRRRSRGPGRGPSGRSRPASPRAPARRPRRSRPRRSRRRRSRRASPASVPPSETVAIENFMSRSLPLSPSKKGRRRSAPPHTARPCGPGQWPRRAARRTRPSAPAPPSGRRGRSCGPGRSRGPTRRRSRRRR